MMNNNKNLKVTENGANGGSRRSASQISIYDYPEHLNPFYEDENHKRIRFWHIGKNKNIGVNSRRGSFSISGIKEMWAFKSFRLKKKSSTLGINKTSESPPPLRRDLDPNGNHYGTYDPRMRHTVGTNNTINNNFLRNVPYRASLQDMRSTQSIERNGNEGIGFQRNDSYRSTIQVPSRNRPAVNSSGSSPQVPPRRYVYGGSVTPQPRLRNNNFDDDYSGISRGSSQISITSKNPFEDEGDDDDVVIRKVSSSSNSKTEQIRERHFRKKRRAPPPPVPIPKAIDENTETNDNENKHEMSAKENTQITNLAVEIQNFIKSKEDDDFDKNETTLDRKSNEEYILAPENIKTCTTKITQEKDEIREEKPNANDILLISEKSGKTELVPDVENELSSEIKISNNESEIKEIVIIEEVSIPSKNTKKEENSSPTKEDTEIILNVYHDKNDAIFKSSNPQNNSVSPMKLTPLSPSSPSTEFNYDRQSIELKISESVEDISERSEKSQKSETSNEIISEIAYVSLNNNNEKKIKETNVMNSELNDNKYRMQMNDNAADASDEDVAAVNIQRRRRSVRDIIESINRNQKLLKINQSLDDNHHRDCNEHYMIKAPPRKKHDFKRFEKEIHDDDKEIDIANKRMKEIECENNDEVVVDNDDTDIDNILEKLADKMNNNDDENHHSQIFQKCIINKEINRESSPTSSNLDWNPVPKPKRTKKLSVDEFSSSNQK